MLAFRMAFIFWISNIPAINKDFLLFKNVSQFSLGNTERLLLLNEIPPSRIPRAKMSIFWALISTDLRCSPLWLFLAIPLAWRGDNNLNFTNQAVRVACDHDLIILSLFLLPMGGNGVYHGMMAYTSAMGKARFVYVFNIEYICS